MLCSTRVSSSGGGRGGGGRSVDGCSIVESLVVELCEE